VKSDPILTALVNFLVPVIFLYGLFFLADFFEVGFFAFIYAIVLFVSGFMIFSVRFASLKSSSIIQTEFVLFFIFLLAISYLVAVFLLITDGLGI
jgi:hypothetical protein